MATGDRPEAIRWFEAAWAAMKPQHTHAVARARTAFTLAKTLGPEQRTRARELATEALEGFGVLDAPEGAEVEDWLAEHPG